MLLYIGKQGKVEKVSLQRWKSSIKDIDNEELIELKAKSYF